MTTCIDSIIENTCVHQKCKEWLKLHEISVRLTPFTYNDRKDNISVAEDYRQYNILTQAECKFRKSGREYR